MANNILIEQHPIHKDYYGTSEGDVISFKGKQPKVIKQCKHGRGYTQFQVYVSTQKSAMYLTHRFIYECFFGEIGDETIQVHHINHIKTDNSIDNLMLVTDAENKALAKAAGRTTGRKKKIK
jgi:hypothetical protein